MAYLTDASGKRLVSPSTGQIALPTLTRYASNPVIPTGTSGAWDDSDVANPDIKWDTRLSKWVMNYSGYDGASWHTGLAYSDDLLTWTKEAANPILSPTGAEGNQATNGSIVQAGGTYYLYYQGEDSQIRLATSTDLTNWTRQGIVLSGTAGQWDAAAVYDPFARLLSDGTIELYYSGATASWATYGIGRATSSDFTTFTKSGQVFDHVSNIPFSTPDCGEPSIYGTGGRRMILLDTSDTLSVRRISQAVTLDDGATWTWRRAILGAGSGWDAVQVFDNCPVVWDGTLYLFYAGAPASGTQGTGAQIGVATATWPSQGLTG